MRAVLLFLDAQDVGGAAIGGEQVGAVFGAEQTSDRIAAGEQADEVVIQPGAEHGVQHVMPGAFGAQLHAQAFEQEAEQFLNIGALAGGGDHAAQRQPQPVFADDADDAEGGAAQRVGVAGAGRLFGDAEEAGQGVQFVRQGDGDGYAALRHRVGRAFGQIMVLHGRGDRFCLAVMGGVVATHDALQFGEFADHAGGQVRFGQGGGAGGLGGIGANQWRDGGGEAGDPSHPCALRTKLGVEGDGVQRRNPAFQGGLAIEVPEMPRVGEAGAQHPFIAGDDRSPTVGAGHVGDEGESGGGFAVRRAQREVALVDAHGDLHHLGRQVHEATIDLAEQWHWPFHQAGHLVDQPRVVHNRIAGRGGAGGDAIGHHLPALGGIHDDLAATQLRLPIGEAGHREFPGREETMALGDVAGD